MPTPYETAVAGDFILADDMNRINTSIAALEDGQAYFREDVGTEANAYKVDFSSGNEISEYQTGQLIVFRAGAANGGASTLQVIGPSGDLDVKDILKNGQPLSEGEIFENGMVTVIYNDNGSGYFEMVGSGFGSGTSSALFFSGCQVFLSSDLELTATVETPILWDSDDIDPNSSHDPGSQPEALFATATGYYEVGLVLDMELDDPDTLLVTMQRSHGNGGGDYCRNEFSVPAGIQAFSLSPVIVYLEQGDSIRWSITAASGDPTIRGGADRRSRCSLKRIKGKTLPCCMVTVGSDQELDTNVETAVSWNGDSLDPNGILDGDDHWLVATNSGYHEVAMLLSMDMPAAESLTIQLKKEHNSVTQTYTSNQFIGATGNNTYNLTPVILQLEVGDRVQWTVTATLDQPTIRSGDSRSRCTMKFLGVASESGGSGESGTGLSREMVGCQLSLGSDVELTATSEQNIHWDIEDIDPDDFYDTGDPDWIRVTETGYYEAGLVLAMDLAAPESLQIFLRKAHGNGSGDYARNEVALAAGYQTLSLTPLMVFLEQGDGIMWTVLPTLADPVIRGGSDRRTRCSLKLIRVVSGPCCQVSVGGGMELVTNEETAIYWDGDPLDPDGMHDPGSEWIVAQKTGYYEVGLVLSMDMPAAESLVVQLKKDHDSTTETYASNEMVGSSGYNLYDLTPVLLYLEKSDRVQWTVTATLDTPTIRGGDLRSRATVRFLGA